MSNYCFRLPKNNRGVHTPVEPLHLPGPRHPFKGTGTQADELHRAFQELDTAWDDGKIKLRGPMIRILFIKAGLHVVAAKEVLGGGTAFYIAAVRLFDLNHRSGNCDIDGLSLGFGRVIAVEQQQTVV